MTKDEIVAGLEGLKDLVNDNGKRSLDVLKAAVKTLDVREAKPAEEVVPESYQVPEEEPVKPEPSFVPKNVVKRGKRKVK